MKCCRNCSMRVVGDFVGVRASSSLSSTEATAGEATGSSSGASVSVIVPSPKWVALLDFMDDVGVGAGLGGVGVLVA